jgi:hypothetical protein
MAELLSRLQLALIAEHLIIGAHRDDSKTLIRIEREQMGIIRDQVVFPGTQSGSKNRAIRRILRDSVTGRPRVHEPGPTGSSTAGQRSQATRKPQLLDQDALEFIEEVIAGVDAPGGTLRGSYDLLRHLAEEGLRDVDVCVEEDLHEE